MRVRSIVFCGHDLSDICSAQVVERVAHAVVPTSVTVPGRAGALLVAGRVPVQDVRVRLFLDPGYKPGGAGVSELRHRLRAWLCSTLGGTLVLPDDPELEYHDAVLTAAGEWSQLFEDGRGDLVFTLFDPVAYGAERTETGTAFEVGGTWATWPVFELVASGGDAVGVYDAATGRRVMVQRPFSDGEVVIIDCASEGVMVDGVDARAHVTMDSDFLALVPGSCELGFVGCSSHTVGFRERWL